MATVNGLTKERMLEIEAKCIVGGAVDLAGHLQLTTRDGTSVDAGSVKGPKGDQGPPASALSAWPIGSIFFNVTSTNPALLLGGGTWQRWAEGRVPIGVWTSDGRFDSPEEFGGEFEHTISWNEMPQHYHGVNDPGHARDSNWRTSYAEAEGYRLHKNIQGQSDGFTNRVAVTGGGYTGTSSSGTGISTQNAGGGAAMNNIQPYVTCYIWKRTA